MRTIEFTMKKTSAFLLCLLMLLGPVASSAQQKLTSQKNKSAAITTKHFADPSTGKNLVVVQNELSNLLALHFLVKHKAVYEFKYGKDAATILHDCLGQRLNSEDNQKISSHYGFTYTVNDNPMIPMDDIYLHPDFGYIRAEGLADDLPGAIQYLNSQIKNFVPTEEEYNKAVEKYKGIAMMLGMGGDKAKKTFDEEYKLLVYETDPYKSKPELTYGNLLAFAKEYLNPANMIVSVVSPASPEKVSALFDLFKGVPVKEEPRVFTATFQLHSKPAIVEKNGGGERSYIFWGFAVQIDPKDAPALQALSLLLSNLIVFDIREKQGMAYNMSAGIEVIQDKALFFISQGTRPKNVDTLVSQYPRFFQMGIVDSLTQSELERSVNMYLGRMMFRRLSS
ncbi:MAG: insulinase family protein, partial [Ignavibacteriales bacterium]|nr:insulinase family protein [Ignavibacteriales bacterium]